MASYLDGNGLLYFWQKIKNTFTVKADAIKNITRSGTTFTATRADGTTFTFTQQDNNTTYTAASATPKMDGTGAVGTSAKYAREDHVHPTDTSRAAVSSTVTDVGADNADQKIHYRINGTVYKSSVPVVNVVFAYPRDGKTPSDADWLADGNSGTVVTYTPQYQVFYLINADQESSGAKKNDVYIWCGTTAGYVKLINIFASSAATSSADGLMSSADKTKLNGIAAGAQVNQNAFSNVKVGSTTVAADAKTDTLELVAGSNVTLTPDATNDKVTIAATDTKYTAASATPLMDGTAAVGTSAKYAREDHKHPSDTSRVPTTRTINGHALSTNVELTAIDVGAISASDQNYIKGMANGVCPLNASNKIDASFLPSYVDDVIEAYPRSGQTELSSTWLSATSGGSALTPEAGKIYVLMAPTTNYAANSQFRWAGSTYVLLQSGEGISAITNSEIDTIVAS